MVGNGLEMEDKSRGVSSQVPAIKNEESKEELLRKLADLQNAQRLETKKNNRLCLEGFDENIAVPKPRKKGEWGRFDNWSEMFYPKTESDDKLSILANEIASIRRRLEQFGVKFNGNGEIIEDQPSSS